MIRILKNNSEFRKFSFAPVEAKIQLLKSYVTPFMDMASFIPELY